MNKEIKVALIGFEYGHQLAYSNELAKIADVRTIGVIRCIEDTEISNERAMEYARRSGVPCVDGLVNGLDTLTPDLVSVALPPSICGAIVLELALRGIHVLTEKPMSFDLDQIRNIRNTARSTGSTIAMAAAASVYTRPIFEAIKLCAEGKIGNIQIVNFQYLQPKGPVYANRTKATGGEFSNFSIYGWIPMSIIANSDIFSVHSLKRCLFYQSYAKEGIDDISVTSIKFSNGTIGTLTVGRIPVKSIPVADIQLEVIGSNGVIRVTNGIGDCVWLYEDFKGADGDYDRGGFNKVMYNASAVSLLAESLVNSIRTGSKVIPGIDDILSYAEFAKLADISNDTRSTATYHGVFT